jgi:hypothetical protein
VRVHLHRIKHVDDLRQSATESVELSKDVHLGKLKLSLLGSLLKFLLRFVEASLVFVVQCNAVIQLLDYLIIWLCPDCLGAFVGNIRLAGGDHLVCDLGKEENLIL